MLLRVLGYLCMVKGEDCLEINLSQPMVQKDETPIDLGNFPFSEMESIAFVC